MTERPALRERIDQAADLYDREVEVREAARRYELRPDAAGGADELYRRAEELRTQRLAVLRACRLI